MFGYTTHAFLACSSTSLDLVAVQDNSRRISSSRRMCPNLRSELKALEVTDYSRDKQHNSSAVFPIVFQSVLLAFMAHLLRYNDMSSCSPIE